MTDYYPLIAKAVSGLDKNTGELRRALYERARAALVGQLRGIDPPLNESDITRERLALEEAIRKVETEASRRKPETREEARPSLTDEGLRGFRAVVAEAESMGTATAEANRAAHEAYEAFPGAPAHEAKAPPTAAAVEETQPNQEYVPEQATEHAEELEVSHAAQPVEEQPAVKEPREPPAWQPPPPPPHFEEATVEESAYVAPRHSFGRMILWLLLIIVIAGGAGAAYWQRHAVTTFIASFRHTPARKPQEQKKAEQLAPKPKITDRIGGERAPAAGNAPAAAVAQKVVLYDEDPNNPQGKRYVGSAIWRTETVSPGPGLAPELAIRADVEIPERHMRMTFSLRRNTDKALPASHTIEIMFTLPPNFDQGGVNNIPGVLMKEQEQARGVPLAGLAVKVTNGYFLIGLSSVDVDKQRNLDLLKNRDWFDIPMVYNTGKRAILAMEKGDAGKRVFEEAFRAWGE